MVGGTVIGKAKIQHTALKNVLFDYAPGSPWRLKHATAHARIYVVLVGQASVLYPMTQMLREAPTFQIDGIT